MLLDEADGGVLPFCMGQTIGGVMFRLRMYCLLAAAILSLSGVIRSANSQPASASDDYTARIQPIFNSRCIACHSCYNAPCQLNLQIRAWRAAPPSSMFTTARGR
jgi:hypothetical protein